jgi:hypothetical protein
MHEKGNNIMSNQRLHNAVGNTDRIIGLTRTPGYTRGGIKHIEGASIPCQPITSAKNRISRSGKRNNPQSISVVWKA